MFLATILQNEYFFFLFDIRYVMTIYLDLIYKIA